jgi:hypothetical protein
VMRARSLGLGAGRSPTGHRPAGVPITLDKVTAG